MPAGVYSSRCAGGKGGGITDEREETSDGVKELKGKDGEKDVALREGGAVETDGIEQYARHGRGSLSGLRT